MSAALHVAAACKEITMTTDNLADSIDALGRAFEEFKHANDNRLAQIERKGSADPLTVEKVEKINGELDRLNSEVLVDPKDLH